MMSRRIGAGAAAAVVFAVVLQPCAAGKLNTAPFDLAADRAAQAREFLTVKNAGALKALRRVAIPFFQVEYAIENKAKASGVSVHAILSGIETDDLQALTDAFYARVVADLTGAGFEVLPHEALRASEAYGKMARRFEDSPVLKGSQDGKSLFFSPTGLPLYFRSNDERLGAFSAIGNAFTTIHPQNYEPRMVQELDAAVLRVRVVVDIAKQSATRFAGKTKPELALMAEFTRYEWLTGDGNVVIVLERYLNMTEQPLEVVEAKDHGMPPINLSGIGGPSMAGTVKLKTVYATKAEDDVRVVGENMNALHDMVMSVVRSSRQGG